MPPLIKDLFPKLNCGMLNIVNGNMELKVMIENQNPKTNVAAVTVIVKQEKLPKDKLNILIELFIIKGNTFAWNSTDYKRETFAAKKLLKEYPDFDFFYTLIDLQNKFNSLLGLQTKWNKPKLQERYKKFVDEKPKEYKLSEQAKLDLPTNDKPKNIFEYLKK